MNPFFIMMFGRLQAGGGGGGGPSAPPSNLAEFTVGERFGLQWVLGDATADTVIQEVTGAGFPPPDESEVSWPSNPFDFAYQVGAGESSIEIGPKPFDPDWQAYRVAHVKNGTITAYSSGVVVQFLSFEG